ncbi:MAG: DUF2147 domain-containing protein [Bacteroidales bacterium]
MMQTGKNLFLLMMLVIAFAIPEVTAQDVKADDILGFWLNEEKDGKVEIYNENGKYSGKLVWLKNPLDDKTGKPKLDKENPDSELKKRALKGVILMHGFEFNHGEWENGKIYDPKNGKTYSCYLKLESPDRLKVRGYIGFSWIGRTTYWTRTTLNN